VTALLVVLGAVVGAPLRHLAGHALNRHHPWGTFLVNVAGSFLLGLVLGAAASPAVTALVGTGFCGALTTYSTFGLEAAGLASTGHRRAALVYALGSVAAGLAAAALGLVLGRAGFAAG
jgi:fluoride exporter